MRLLWISNAEWAATGYGQQTKHIVPGLESLGHKVAIFPFWGLQGGLIEYNGRPNYPIWNNEWGNDVFAQHAEHFKADLVITLTDVWVLHDEYGKLTNWCLPYDAIIETIEGRKTIGEVVDHKLPVLIKTYSEEKQEPIFARIEEYQKIPYNLTGKLLKIKTATSELEITSDNQILTQRGWITAAKLLCGDMVRVLDSLPIKPYNKEYDDITAKRNMETSDRTNRELDASRNRLSGGDYRRRGDYLNPENNKTKDTPYSFTPYKHQQYRCSSNRMVGVQNKCSGKYTYAAPPTFNSLCDDGFRISLLSDIETDRTLPHNQAVTSENGYEIYRDEVASPVQFAIHRDGDQNMAEGKGIKFERVAQISDSTRTPSFVYDLKTSEGNFFANGILIHNCPYVPIDHVPAPPAIVSRLKLAKRSIAMSRFGQEELKKAGIVADYIPHGVDTETFKPVTPEQKAQAKMTLGFPPDCFLVGMVAANKGWPCRKCFSESFEAFAMFLQKHPNARMYCHSEPSNRYGGPDLSAMAHTFGIQPFLRFPNPYMLNLGFPDTQMAETVYAAFDVLLAASSGEGFGVPIIEAEACGLPVITTDCTSMPELTAAGWKVPVARKFWTPLNAFQFLPFIPGIADALEAAYTADRVSMGKVAREFAMDYRWKKVINEGWKPVLEKLEPVSYAHTK